MLLVVVAALLLSAGTGLAQDAHLSAGAGGGFSDLLSRPLPGTPERADADAARALDEALTAFTGVTAATVIVTRATDTPSADRRAAVQLTLADDCAPTPAWVEGIASFATQALPHLAPDQLTIVTADGAVLYARGSAVVVPAPEPGRRARGALAGRPGTLLAAAAAGCALVVAAVLVIGRRREPRPAIAEAQPEPGPFAFIAEVSDDELRRALAGERPEVLGLVARAVDEAQAERVRASADGEAASLATGAAEPEVVAAVAAALRRKLVER